ncbi:MAG: hypothetical protein U0M13_01255, partial [Desulfovibrio fairfieldensis]|nr:hypothetical protein [Desulfovibrio fairfieldensis]
NRVLNHAGGVRNEADIHNVSLCANFCPGKWRPRHCQIAGNAYILEIRIFSAGALDEHLDTP